MKNFVKFFTIALCVMLCGTVLVACGKKATTPVTPTVALTAENVEGLWKTASIQYVPHADSEYKGYTLTWEQWKALEANNSKTDDELDQADVFEDRFYTFSFTEDNKIYCINAGTTLLEADSVWSITDDQLGITTDFHSSTVVSAEWKNGTMIITVRDLPAENADCPGEWTYTLVKLI